MDENQIKALAESIDAKITKLADEGKNMTDAAKAELKSELSAMVKDFNELQKSVDSMKAESKRLQEPENKGLTSLADAVTEITKSDDFKSYLADKKKGRKAKFEAVMEGVSLKTAITPSTATAAVVAPDQLIGVYHDPDRRLRIRDYIPVAPTSSNRVVVPVEKTITDGTAVTAEGIQKGVSQFTLDIESFPVMKIASVHKISEEMLDDIPGLVAYITQRFGAKLKNKEDYVLLYNTESSTEFNGLTVAAQAYDDDLADTAVSKWDVLINAVYQAISDEYRPTVVFINPADGLSLRTTKGSDEHYIGGTAPWNPAPLSVLGVPIVETTAIGSGEFLVGDAAMGAIIYDRMTPSIRFYDQDEDNAQKNLITVVVEERLALAIVRPNAFVYGDFASALAEGTA